MLHDTSASQPQLSSKRDLTLCEVADSETGSVLRTTFCFVDAYNNAWFGQIPHVRKYDLDVKDLQRNLRRIPDEIIYPKLTAGLTIIADDDDAKRYYIKRPKLLCLDNPEETQLLPKMLLEEAQILESLKPHRHDNLVRYHGCVSKQDRLAGIALEKYDVILLYRFEDDVRPLDVHACMSGIRAGVELLHSLGLAHNDLNPMNIALDENDRPVILDFGSCKRFGSPLSSGGTPGWIDEDYSTSAQCHDERALQKIDSWLSNKQTEHERDVFREYERGTGQVERCTRAKTSKVREA